MFIVTNCTPIGNYKPSVFETLEAATDWVYECTAENIKSYIGHDLEGMNNKQVCLWGESNLNVKISIGRTEIYYYDDSYNIMEIFEVNV